METLHFDNTEPVPLSALIRIILVACGSQVFGSISCCRAILTLEHQARCADSFPAAFSIAAADALANRF